MKELLRKSCAYDFHEAVFYANSCVRTTFAKTQVLVVNQENDGIDLVVRRSYSDYVYRWITDASRELAFAYPINRSDCRRTLMKIALVRLRLDQIPAGATEHNLIV